MLNLQNLFFFQMDLVFVNADYKFLFFYFFNENNDKNFPKSNERFNLFNQSRKHHGFFFD